MHVCTRLSMYLSFLTCVISPLVLFDNQNPQSVVEFTCIIRESVILVIMFLNFHRIVGKTFPESLSL